MPSYADQKTIFRATDEGGFLLDVTAGTVFGFTPVAAVAWPVLSSGSGLDAAVAAVLENFDIDEATARTHLDHLITSLREHGLLERKP
ncbi:PqqD family protein [Sphaerisporangium sp. NPDC051017]|uniref:PqqD family protein n=1 Tax=Sphaerisporangium sp. NPDC051017 TaxID=3154636 RepID=UPI00342B87AF